MCVHKYDFVSHFFLQLYVLKWANWPLQFGHLAGPPQHLGTAVSITIEQPIETNVLPDHILTVAVPCCSPEVAEMPKLQMFSLWNKTRWFKHTKLTRCFVIYAHTQYPPTLLLKWPGISEGFEDKTWSETANPSSQKNLESKSFTQLPISKHFQILFQTQIELEGLLCSEL